MNKKREKEYISIYNRFKTDILRFVLSRINNNEEALDITSKVFMKLFINFDTIKIVTVRAWLYKVAHNEIIDFYRKSRPEINVDQIDDEYLFVSTDPSNEKVSEELKQKEIIKQQIKKMKEIDKKILTLKIYDELKFEEISDVLDMNIATIKTIYYRAVKTLEKI